MPKVYGVNASPFVRKVRVCLEEKRVAYDLDPILPFNTSPEYKKMSPLGKIPAFQDGDVTLCDSSVICAYLERIHPEPAVYPADPFEYARALWFEEYADTAIVQVAGPKIFTEKVVAPLFFKRPTNEAVLSKAINEELPPLLEYLEGQLRDGAGTIAGEQFSIGDIGVATQFVNLRYAGVTVDAGRWPKLARYIDGILERSSFKKLIAEEEVSFRSAG